MDKPQKSFFIFENYKVNHVEYFFNNNFKHEEPIEIDFSIGVEININQEEPYKGIVTMKTIIFEDAIENNYPFTLKLSINGYFSAEDVKVTIEDFTKFCERSGTATLFPFLRTVISDITKAANVEPLILPLINVHQLMKEKTEEK